MSDLKHSKFKDTLGVGNSNFEQRLPLINSSRHTSKKTVTQFHPSIGKLLFNQFLDYTKLQPLNEGINQAGKRMRKRTVEDLPLY